ncbi:Poly(R)-hydroxyalkanoic acid synthase subunit (PHA_synth_III_E) [uncultured archaeon]|nr:Poly(R)-hydroxyalkanoic acid synthase subunit (PHA_synth_III_E) [uncultured archaeon]
MSMARRRTTTETGQTREEMESEEKIKEEQTAARGAVSTTPSSWWEDRKTIEQPRPEDQERSFREEQERFEQERKTEKYYRPIQDTERAIPAYQERHYREEEEKFEPQEQMEVESEGRKEVSRAGARRDIPTTPSSWWEARKTIERPSPEDQEKRYRDEQERYEQERQKESYYNKPIQELLKEGKNVEEIISMKEQERPAKEMRGEGEEKRDISQAVSGSYAAVSRMLEDSFTNLQKPWIDSTVELFNKAAELSRNATPENYKAFYDEWMKTYQNTFGKLYPSMTRQLDKETLEKLKESAEESKALFQSWISMLDENSRKTQELLQGTPDAGKYRELYNMWTRTYGKIFQDFIEMPTKGNTGAVFETYGGMPNIYFKNFAQIAKLWNDSYLNMFRPWVDSMLSFSDKMAELSKGETKPEAYKEFYNLWIDTYRNTYGRLFNIQSVRSASKEMTDSFVKSMEVNLNIYNSWVSALEKISQKTTDISKQAARPEAYKEPYNAWVSMYERAFDDFFTYVPVMSPVKPMMEPVKNAARAYTDMFTSMSGMWMRPAFGSASMA